MDNLLKQYIEERRKWVLAGKPMRTEDRMAEIHQICSTKCKHFVPGGGLVPGYDRCGICQCNLHPTHTVLNKIAWATTHCPDKEDPKWEEDK